MSNARIRRAVLSLLAALLAASASCSGDNTPVAPAPSPFAFPTPTPRPAPSTVAVSGTVYDHSVSPPMPLAGLPLLILGSERIQLTTDADGRYEIESMPGGFIYVRPLESSGYHAPCPPGSVIPVTNAILNVHVASSSTLASSGMPVSIPLSAIRASGRVFDANDRARAPIAGALIEFDAFGDRTVIMASTVSGLDGRYLVCTAPPGVGTGQKIYIRASHPAYGSTVVPIIGGWNAAHIGLKRRVP